MTFDELNALACALRPQKLEASLRGYELSTETLRRLEVACGPMVPSTNQSNTLWGIPIYINEALPLNEVKPLYRTETNRVSEINKWHLHHR